MDLRNRKTGRPVRLLSVTHVRVFDPQTQKSHVIGIQQLEPIDGTGRIELLKGIADCATMERKAIERMKDDAVQE